MSQETKDKSTCQSCGGQLFYSPEHDALVCTICDSVQGGKGTEEQHPQEEKPAFCPNCGGEFPLGNRKKQMKCGFCDSFVAILSADDDCPVVGEIPEDHKFILPFSFGEDAYKESMISWMAEYAAGAPLNFFDKMAIVRSPKGYYMPRYLVVANYDVDYTASIGYQRVETYVEYENQEVDGETRSVAVTRERIVTDWQPFQSSIRGKATNMADGNMYIADIYHKAATANNSGDVAAYDMETNTLTHVEISVDSNTGKPTSCKPYEHKYTAGYEVLAPEIPVHETYQKEKIHEQIRAAIAAQAPGDEIKDIVFHGTIVPDYFLIYCPTWTTLYSYEKEIYVTNSISHDSSVHRATYPVDTALQTKTTFIMLPFYILLIPGIVSLIIIIVRGLLDSPFTVLDDVTMIIFLATLATGLIGGIISTVINKQRKKALMHAAQKYKDNPHLLFGRMSNLKLDV